MLILLILHVLPHLAANIPPGAIFNPTPPYPTPIDAQLLVQPTPILQKINTVNSEPWGIAKQLDTHTWTIKIANDPAMGTPGEILQALNNYRQRYGRQTLVSDSRLCTFAQTRADQQNKLGSTDSHQGFIKYLENDSGFTSLGYGRLGENSSYGYIMSGVHLIEFVYHSDPDHDANQLNNDWDHACVGISGSATDIIFATSPL